VVCLTQELREDHRFRFWQWLSQPDWGQEISLVSEQRLEAIQLQIKILIATLCKIDGNQACFHDFTLMNGNELTGMGVWLIRISLA
jgi:hypothetical protein